VSTATNTEMNPDEGWETIGEESGILFKWDKPGETFTGIFQGSRHIVPPNSDDPDDEFDQQMFLSNEDGTDGGDILFVHNGGYKVREALTDDYIGWLVRLTYIKDVPVKGQASDMKDVKVQARPL
jgi:hypothetical protein